MTWRERLREQRALLRLIISGLLVQVIINLLSSWLEKLVGPTPGRILQLVIGLCIAALVLWAVLRLLGREPAVEIVPKEEKAHRFPGLIALVGPGREGKDPMKQAAVVAIEHHLAPEGPGESLRNVWLVTGRGERGGVPVTEAIRNKYAGGCEVRVCTVADAFDLQETYALVRRIYTEDLPELGLHPQQVVADLSGGTAMMTAGMAVACRDRWPMEYVTGGKEGMVPAPVLVRWEPVAPREEA